MNSPVNSCLNQHPVIYIIWFVSIEMWNVNNEITHIDDHINKQKQIANLA